MKVWQAEQYVPYEGASFQALATTAERAKELADEDHKHGGYKDKISPPLVWTERLSKNHRDEVVSRWYATGHEGEWCVQEVEVHE